MPRGAKRRFFLPAEPLAELYVKQQKNAQHIAGIYGCSKPTVLMALREHGIPIRHHNDTKRGAPSPHRIDLDAASVVRCYLEKRNRPISDVARRFGVNRSVVERVLRASGVPHKPVTQVIAGTRNGKNNPNWKPHLTDEQRAARRDNARQARWRSKVYARDGYRCVACGDSSGGNLNAHHIESYAANPFLRWDVENGATLCVDCHRAFHSAHGLTTASRAQLMEFIAGVSP